MSKPGRNDLCHCGSGKKYKKCHASKESNRAQGNVLMAVVGVAIVAAVVAAVFSFSGQAPESSGTGVRIWDPAHGHYHDANGVQVP